MDGPYIEQSPGQFLALETIRQERLEPRQVLPQFLPPPFDVEEGQDARDEVLVVDIRAGEEEEVLLESERPYGGPQRLRGDSPVDVRVLGELPEAETLEHP